MDINKKIIKYTEKLKKAKSDSKSEFYQKKLHQYHNMNKKTNREKYIEMFSK